MSDEKPIILIIDDNPSNIQLLAPYLTADYQIKVATDGILGLKIAKEEHAPSLILLDIMMPEMDGYEVCRRLKKENNTIPIIFITAMDDDKDEEFGLKLGAVDYIVKPFVPSIVSARIKTHLELKLHRDHLEELVKERTSTLDKALIELAQSNRLKQIFLNTISHELRTPMNGILGCLDTIGGKPNYDHTKMLASARQSASELMCIVEDILVFSEIQAGSLVLGQCSFSLQTLLDDLLKNYEALCKEKGLEFEYSFPPLVSGLVGDPRYLRIILDKVLQNALKFTSNDKIGFGVHEEESTDKDNETCFQFTVFDTGIGIAKEDQEKIFQSFRQLDGAFDRTYGGVGIGLAICQHLVKLMNGEITVSSQLGQGSKFTLEIPFKKPTKASLETDSREEKKASVTVKVGNRKILLVEDNRVNQIIEKKFLTNHDYEVSLAENVI